MHYNGEIAMNEGIAVSPRNRARWSWGAASLMSFIVRSRKWTASQ
jgi:hypothetical protein